MAKLQKGDKVQVFQMWKTRTEPEGVASLVVWIGADLQTKGADQWWVHFDEDGDDGSTYYRTVWPKDKVA